MKLIGRGLTYFQVLVFNYKDKDPSFKIYDRAFAKQYRFINPYQMSKGTYGETPLATYRTIIKECDLTANDHIVDLGCGRGRGVFYVSHYLKCKVDGIEYSRAFVDKANKIKEELQVQKVCFLNRDLFESNLSSYSAIYLYGTCLSDREILSLIKKFKKLSQNPKIITVSYSLSEYDASFKTLKSFPVTFPWGETDAYLNLSD